MLKMGSEATARLLSPYYPVLPRTTAVLSRAAGECQVGAREIVACRSSTSRGERGGASGAYAGPSLVAGSNSFGKNTNQMAEKPTVDAGKSNVFPLSAAELTFSDRFVIV
jgi:hypothetical protein